MKLRTGDLTGLALHWAVAEADGTFAAKSFYDGYRVINGKLHLTTDGKVVNDPYSPTTNWLQGGTLIERENLS